MPDLDPQQEARLRRLLAEARHEEPIPVDVAARLDDVLARLSDEPEPVAAPPVADLAAKRRRRVTLLLAAAAAVVVAGVGIGRVTGVQHDNGPGRDDAGASAAREPMQADRAAPETRPSPQADESFSTGTLSGESQPGLRAKSTRIPRVSATAFGADVARVQARLGRLATTAPFEGTAAMCDPADWGPGMLVAVRFEHAPAVLVFRPATGSTQVADLLQCGSGEVLRSTSLPTR